MKIRNYSRNTQHLNKLNSLSKEVLSSARYVHDIDENHENKNNLFQLNTKTDLMNPLFKEKLYGMLNEFVSRNKTISPNHINGNYTSRTYYNNPLNDEKRKVLNMKKNEILYLLNPFNEKFNINKEKEKNFKKRPINIKSLYKISDDNIKFPDKVRNEINKILSKNEMSRNTNIQDNEKKKSNIPKLKFKTKHKKASTSFFQ